MTTDRFSPFAFADTLCTEFVTNDADNTSPEFFMEEPENIYNRLTELNRNLPNIQKWAIISGAFERQHAEPYDPAKHYDLFEFVYSRYNLGQLHELRQVLPLFYKDIRPDPDILRQGSEEDGSGMGDHRKRMLSAGESSGFMAERIAKFCQEGFTYRAKNACPDDVSSKDNNEHFHLIPFPQRTHMNFPKFIWVLAFMLEGVRYEFVENPAHEEYPQYFRFYAKYEHPSKLQLQDYQEMRRLMGEHFVEIPKCPSSATYPLIPALPRRYDRDDEPQWWELRYSRRNDVRTSDSRSVGELEPNYLLSKTPDDMSDVLFA